MATYNNIKKIKIGDNTFNLYDSGNSGGTITSVKTTAGTHSAINVSSGAVSFNVPTKTSHLTNDSGFVTTDEKVKITALKTNNTYYPILASGTGTATRQIDSTRDGLKYVSTAGTTSEIGSAVLTLGNQTASGTANNEKGVLRICGTTAYYDSITIENNQPTANRTIYLPSYAGTMYLTCTNTTDAVGSTSVPVYVDNVGRIQAVDSIALGLVEKPFMRATGSTTNVNLSSGVITQVPLYTVEFQSEYSGISLDTTKHTILLEPGYYRISGSVYFASGVTYSSMQGIYIRMDLTDTAFANATEVAASYIYGALSINTSTIVKVVDNCYLWLGARSSTAAAVDSDNTATYLTAEKIGSIY